MTSERAGRSRRDAREDRVEELQRTVRRLLDDNPADDDPALTTARKDLSDARADLEDAVRDHHDTLRRSGLRPS